MEESEVFIECGKCDLRAKKIRNPSLDDDEPPKLGRPSAGATNGRTALSMLPAPPPPLDGLDGEPGRLLPPPELPPPPNREPMAGARTGKRAAAVEPEPEPPVAALRRVPNTLVRSGPFPPVDGGGLLGGGLLGLGVVLSFLLISSSSSSSSSRFLSSSSSLDLQHTVPLSHLYLSSTSLHTDDIICGMQTPGHFRLTLLDDDEDDDDFGREVDDFLLS